MARRTPWDTVSVDVINTTSVAKAMEEAGALFTVELVPGKYKWHGNDYEAKGYNYIIRTDLPEVLGMCKERYKPLQNSILVEMLQPMITSGKAKLDTIGVSGPKVWLLAELAGHNYTIRPDDNIKLYLLLVNSHDGSTSVMVGVVPVRVWCSNMFPRIGKELIKFKHTAHVEEMLIFFTLRVSAYLSKVDEYVQRLIEMEAIHDFDIKEYFTKVFNLTESTRSKNKLNKLLDLFGDGKSLYDAFNAVTEYLNYEAGRNQSTRLNSLWFGKNSTIAQKALDVCFTSRQEGPTKI